MIEKNNTEQFPWFPLFGGSLLFVGLIYSSLLQIIGMVLLLLPSFLNLEFKPLSIRFKKNITQRFLLFLQNKNYLVITLIFWISFISVLNSDNLEKWWFFTSMKIPFLVLPFFVFNLPKWNQKHFYQLILVFILVVFSSSFALFSEIIKQPQTWQAIILKGQSIPTPIDHIKYSLFLSFSLITGLIILLQRKNLIFRGEKIILGIILAYLFVFLHLLAVRSGIVILYVNLAVYLLTILIRKKQYIQSIAVIAVLAAIPVIAYFSLPTFRAKVQYTVRDFKMSQQNKEMDYSDGERLRSYKIGMDIFETSPVTGVGVGDIFSEFATRYQAKYFTENPTNLPHNQFMTVAVSTGVIGLIFFCISFFFPFAWRNAWQDPLLMALFVLMLLSFLVENTLERQYSVSFYLVFLLLGMKQFFEGQGKESLSEKN